MIHDAANIEDVYLLVFVGSPASKARVGELDEDEQTPVCRLKRRHHIL